MRMSIGWVEDNLTEENSAAIFTDSQSICVALLGSSTALDELRLRISRVRARLLIQWIPGHSNIPGNELADSAAKVATLAPGQGEGSHIQASAAPLRLLLETPRFNIPTPKRYTLPTRVSVRVVCATLATIPYWPN